jgi:type IV pilus biogenesis protein PilP
MRSEWRSEWLAVLAACAVLVAAPARAGPTADDLARIEAEHMVLKARLRVLETRALMAARQADIERYEPGVQGSGMPTVAGIEGASGKLQATVLMGNGFTTEVLQGDMLPNGMRVVSIRHDGVVAQGADRKRVRLKPASEQPDGRGPTLTVASDPAAAPGVERMPVMPPAPPRIGSPR